MRRHMNAPMRWELVRFDFLWRHVVVNPVPVQSRSRDGGPKSPLFSRIKNATKDGFIRNKVHGSKRTDFEPAIAPISAECGLVQ